MARILRYPHPHHSAVAVPAEGVGPTGDGAAPISPGPFPSRGAALAYDDVVRARPARRAARGYVGLQLSNGRSGVSPTGRVVPFFGVFRNQARPVRASINPGDRVMIPPSPGQVAGWTSAGAGSTPDNLTGNGSVLAGVPFVGGGSY